MTYQGMMCISCHQYVDVQKRGAVRSKSMHVDGGSKNLFCGHHKWMPHINTADDQIVENQAILNNMKTHLIQIKTYHHAMADECLSKFNAVVTGCRAWSNTISCEQHLIQIQSLSC